VSRGSKGQSKGNKYKHMGGGVRAGVGSSRPDAPLDRQAIAELQPRAEAQNAVYAGRERRARRREAARARKQAT